MRKPIREKLANIGRQSVQILDRKGFTPKQRQMVYDEFDGLCGCGCDEPLAGEAWDIDHAVPLALGGKHDLSNWIPRLKAHHKRKTASDIKSISKAKRIAKRETEGPKPAKLKGGGKIQSAGFRKDISRRMNGSVVRR